MSFVLRIGRTGNRVSSHSPRAPGAEDRPDPPIINLPNRISSASRRLEKVGNSTLPARNSSSSRHSFLGLFFFSLFDFSDVDDSNNSNGHVSRVARRRADSFLRISSSRSKSRENRAERMRERDGRRDGNRRVRERGKDEEGEGSVGRSVGRSEVPFCFSASVWRRDSSGTLSERDVITTPLLLPSQGVPRALHLLPAPVCQSPFPTPATSQGYNVDQAQGLPDWLPCVLRPFFRRSLSSPYRL